MAETYTDDASGDEAAPGMAPRKPVYTEADLAGIAHLGSAPGASPFVRGPYASMYTDKPWTIRQYAGFAGAEASNAFFHELLRGGAQGLSVAFDLPTHRGYDSDHPAVAADVGLAGVAIDSVEDMKRLFKGVDLARVSVSMTMSGAVLPVLACFIVAARESGVAPAQLTGTIQNDILKEYLVRNTYIFAPAPSLRIATDVVAHAAREMPRFNAMSISGYHFQEAGADGPLELALTLANARQYLRELCGRGLDVDAFCRSLSFFFGVGSDFFSEVAKLRAARLLWSEVVTASGGKLAKSQAMRMHCQTSGWSLSAQAPLNNVVRTTVQAMAAVFGGTQSLHTNAYDEALALPSDEAARLARDTQLILQHETGLCEVVDPWAGSYMMERMTADLADAARALLREIEEEGGVVQALASGWLTRRIHIAATRTQAGIDAGRRVIVGMNAYEGGQAPSSPVRKIDAAAIRRQQTERLVALRAGRDAAAVASALDGLAACAAGEGNLLAATIAAIEARATVGECTAALETLWPRHGVRAEYSAGVYAEARAGDDPWQRAKQAVARHGSPPPRILVAKLGQDGHDRGAKAVAGALADAGFEVRLGGLFATPEEVAQLARRHEVDAVGISSLAGAHLDMLPRLIACLREMGLGGLPVVVGGVVPQADHAVLHAAGVSAIFGPGTQMETIVADLLGVLRDAQAKRASAATAVH
jgi:methylmalonyl-CoA mutase